MLTFSLQTNVSRYALSCLTQLMGFGNSNSHFFFTNQRIELRIELLNPVINDVTKTPSIKGTIRFVTITISLHGHANEPTRLKWGIAQIVFQQLCRAIILPCYCGYFSSCLKKSVVESVSSFQQIFSTGKKGT